MLKCLIFLYILTLFLTKKNPFETMAGHWAVKEAFSKAVKTGVRDFSLNEISVLRDELGAPYLELTGKAKELAKPDRHVRIARKITINLNSKKHCCHN